MPTYAAIKLTRDTITTIMANVEEVPNGQEKLIWAMFKYPFESGVTYYYIGGNYRNVNWPDYSLQILTQTELDLMFKYRAPKAVGSRPAPHLQWFPVTLKENLSPDMIIISREESNA